MRTYAYYADAGLRTRILNRVRRLFTHGPLETMLARLVRGKHPQSLLARVVPMEYLYPNGSWRTVERHGSSLELDLSNTTDHGAFFDLADAGAEAFNNALKPTDTVVDIGANIGIRTLGFARRVPAGRVVSFEPHPRTFERLRSHVERNGCSNVLLLNMGVGEVRRDERIFEVVGSNSGMNRILPSSSQDSSIPSEAIVIAPLDEVLREHGISQVDAIKMDVEGYEMHVLKGSRQVIERDRPLLFIELDDTNLRENGSSAAELVDLLVRAGYTVLRADTNEDLPGDLLGTHFDILCRHTRP